nr:3TM-type holin [Methylobacterium sp. P1-11]
MAKVIVDRTIPDPQKKVEVQAEIEQALTARETALTAALQAENEQQNAINLAEAQGNDRFSSRWRPALGWACVAAFLYQFLAAPVVTWLGAILGVMLGIAFPAPPTIVVSDISRF